MKANFLKPNSDTSEILIIGPKFLYKSCYDFSLCIDGFTLPASTHIPNLGGIFDQTLSFGRYVLLHYQNSFFFHLQNIARLCPSLSFSVAEKLIHTFITSPLDHCNSILYCTSTKILDTQQYIQNSRACLLTHSRTRDHIPQSLQTSTGSPFNKESNSKVSSPTKPSTT